MVDLRLLVQSHGLTMRSQLGNLFLHQPRFVEASLSASLILLGCFMRRFVCFFVGYMRKRVAPMKITFGQGVGVRRRTPPYFPCRCVCDKPAFRTTTLQDNICIAG